MCMRENKNNRFSIRNKLKRAATLVLTCATVVSSVSTVELNDAYAATSILGTNSALGSPILNNNATTDDWNKWEMVCWGVYLSNFCQPLIDNYASAFTTGNGGTEGAGYQALCFGTGSDQTNNEVIEDFTSYAIKVQEESTKKNVYVGYTQIVDGQLQNKVDPNDTQAMADASKALRYATFNDFIFQSVSDLSDTDKTAAQLELKSYENYNDVLKVKNANVPTFYVQDANGKYVTILDYTNSWDIQAFASIINAVRTSRGGSKDYSSEFNTAFKDNMNSNGQVYMDCFANLMVNNKMLFPACNNRNITIDKSINIMNSWLVNSYSSSASGETMVKNLQSPKYSTFTTVLTTAFNAMNGALLSDQDYCYSGTPAFGGSSSLNGQGVFYFDTDSIVTNDYTDSVNYGEMITKLFNQNISSDSYKYNIKFEVAGAESNLLMSFFADNVSELDRTAYMASMIPNIVGNDSKSQPEVLDYILRSDGVKTSIIGDNPVVVAPMLGTAETDSGFVKNAETIRVFYNWLYKVYSSGDKYTSTAGTINVQSLKDEINNCANQKDLKNLSKEIWKCFIADYPDYKKKGINSFADMFDFAGNESISSKTARLTLAYPVSSTMQQVSSVLRLEDNTEFGVYSAYIYMTYLDWYGVVNEQNLVGGTDGTSKFDPSIYDETSDIFKTTPDKISDNYKSKKDRDEEIAQMTYLMLSPESGREYRQEILYNGIADFLYKQYNRIVYGGESSVTTGNTTKSNSGFLAVPTYTENVFTGWFLNIFLNIAVILIGLVMLAVVIIGLLKKRKVSWYILSLIVAVNVIILIPTTGEITPYVTSGFTQKIFSSKMTYWTLSEGITNAELENQANSKDSEMTSEVLGWVNRLSAVYTDRSLMVKQDTSQKVTQKVEGVYTNIQSIKSARWVLPMVMQQFSADRQEDTSKYVYIKLADMWDDGSNLYWYYKPSDADFVTKPTLTSKQFTDGTANCIDESVYHKQASDGTGNYIDGEYYTDYVNPSAWADDTSTNVNYASYSYTLNDDLNDNVHTYAWLLHDNSLNMNSTLLKRQNVFGSSFESYKGADSWQLLIDAANTNLSGNLKNWQTTKDGAYGYESISDSYDRTDTSTLKDGYGYYKTTETPYYYFFDVVKDSFPNNKVVGAIIGRLQGEIDNTDEKKVRNNFMYATTSVNKEHEDGYSVDNAEGYTGDVRDILDLQCFFTNTIPYMYEMTLVSGGFDGESGLLGDSTISDESTYYKGNLQSWAYRCNWAVKLMENNNYSKPSSAKLPDGTKVTIQNPMLPECYEAAGRQMVFSEAQRNALGLSNKDLTLVELKCIEVNKQVAERWTLLINYASTDGLTKEVLFRVMATDATEIFCQEFSSSSGILDTNYELYPQSIDLRYLSFDAIMKMLMVNISKDTSYAYGDTMDNLLNDSDLFTAFLLLLCAVLCTWLIPLCQQLIMAAIFFLGFLSIIRALFSSQVYKMKLVGAQLVSNLMFMVYTIVYYGIIAALMALSSSGDVLSVNQITAKAGNPVWMFLIIIVVSCAYIFIMYKHLCFCFAHYRDMGLEVMSFVTSEVIGKMQDFAGNISNSLQSLGSSEEVNGTGSTSSISGTGISNNSTTQIILSKDSNISVSGNENDTDNFMLDDTNVYSSGDDYFTDLGTSSEDIDYEIKKGARSKKGE